MLLTFDQFYGLRYRGVSKVTTASNVAVEDGALMPLREDLGVPELVGNGAYCGCDWVQLPDCAKVSTWNTLSCQQLVVTPQEGEAYIHDCNDNCVPTPIALDAPISGVGVTGGVTDLDRTAHDTRYAIAYETCRGFEGALTIVGGSIFKTDDTDVQLSGLPIPPSYVKQIHIYRTQTGYRSGTEEISERTTSWHRVGSISPGTTTFTDNTRDAYNAHVRLPNNITHAPKGIRQVTSIPQSDQLVGYLGKELYRSGKNPHNWPEPYVVGFDQNIVGLGVGEHHTVVFTSAGDVYRVHHGNDADTCPTVHKYTGKYFLIPCCDQVRETTYGVLALTYQGLIRFGPRGAVENLTEQWFDVDNWNRLVQSGDSFIEKDGVMYITSRTQGIMYRLTLKPSPSLTTIETGAVDQLISSPTGEVIYRVGSEHYHLFGGVGYRTFTYEFEVQGKGVYRWATTDADFLMLYSDSCNGENDTPVNNNCQCIPTIRVECTTHIRLVGKSPTSQIKLATTKRELVR